MKKILRANHEELLKKDIYKRDFDIRTMEAKHIENLKIKGLTVTIKKMPNSNSWYDYSLYLEYKGFEFLFRRGWNTLKDFSVYIQHPINRQNFKFRQQAEGEIKLLNNFAFLKVTNKKFVAKLEEEIILHLRTISLFDEFKIENLEKYSIACKRIEYIVDVLGLETKEIIYDGTKTYSVKYQSEVDLYCLRSKLAATIHTFNYETNIDYHLEQTVKLINKILGKR